MPVLLFPAAVAHCCSVFYNVVVIHGLKKVLHKIFDEDSFTSTRYWVFINICLDLQ